MVVADFLAPTWRQIICNHHNVGRCILFFLTIDPQCIAVALHVYLRCNNSFERVALSSVSCRVSGTRVLVGANGIT